MVGPARPPATSAVAPEKPSRLQENLMEMERCRERYWRGHPGTSALKLRWRAATVRHSFHVLPGESILELGAGSGLWTEHLSTVLRGQNPITAAVFNNGFIAQHRDIPNTRFVRVDDLLQDLATKALITSSAPQFFATTYTRKIWRPSGGC